MAKAVTAANQNDPQVILTVADAKAALRVPAAVDIDTELIGNINQAASWVGNAISAPVLDVERYDDLLPQSAARGAGSRLYVGEVPWRNLPITIYDRRWVREVVKIEWWDQTGNLSDPPNRTLLPADFGRVDILDAGALQDTLQVFPPAARGWPVSEDVLPASRIRITTISGLDMTEPYAGAVRRGVIEGTKQLQGNEGTIRFNSNFERILGPLMAV